VNRAADEDWQSITNPLAREDQRRYEGAAWDELPGMWEAADLIGGSTDTDHEETTK
jgi:hypothetical protein